MHPLQKCILGLTVLYSSNSSASIDLDQLKRLFDSGNSQAAYEYAHAEVLSHEGEPTFDYYYGASAIDVGQCNEGVYALERVLVSQPNNHAARLELARGYFILQEYARASAEFNTVLKYDPPDDVREKIYDYLDTIRLQEDRYKTTSTAYVELGYGADSNINSGPSNPTIIFLGQTGQLNASALEQNDNVSRIRANYGVATPLTAKTSFNASINASLSKNTDHSELDSATYTESAGLRFLHAQDSYSIDLIAQQFSIDGTGYRQLTGINTNWSRHLSQLSTLQAFLQLSMQDFDGQEARNVDTSTLGIGFTSRFKVVLSPVIFSSLYIAQDKPERSSDIAKQIAERDYYGVRIGTVLNTSLKTSSQFSVNYQSSQYGLEDINGILREDRHTSAELNFTWLLSRNWSLLADASYINNDSSNTINAYDRKQFIVSLHYEMK
ncbi:MAG: surface lipoprotein assembly modifier [Gammaproteobacteria bacterium]|nr:surface lipoprotein assembly modifier [Gammaproteobacteria bacterium]